MLINGEKKNLMAFSHSSVSGSCLLSLAVLVSAQQQSYVEFYVIIIGNQMTWILVSTLALCSLYTASPKSLLVIAIYKIDIHMPYVCVCVSRWRRYCCSIILFCLRLHIGGFFSSLLVRIKTFPNHILCNLYIYFCSLHLRMLAFITHFVNFGKRPLVSSL